MCKFCDKCDDLQKEKINLGILGNGELGLEMDVREDGVHMSAWIYFDCNDGYESVCKKIDYCPFCGRKLSEVSENE